MNEVFIIQEQTIDSLLKLTDSLKATPAKIDSINYINQKTEINHLKRKLKTKDTLGKILSTLSVLVVYLTITNI